MVENYLSGWRDCAGYPSPDPRIVGWSANPNHEFASHNSLSGTNEHTADFRVYDMRFLQQMTNSQSECIQCTANLSQLRGGCNVGILISRSYTELRTELGRDYRRLHAREGSRSHLGIDQPRNTQIEVLFLGM